MGDKSAIEWTDATWNPVRGCSIVSKGCTNCYAMRMAHRSSGAGGAYQGLTKMSKGGPVWNGRVKLVHELLEQPVRWRRPRRIFVNSMSDLFHEDVPDEFIDKVFAVMGTAKWHQFQLLTKRPARMLEWFSEKWQPATEATQRDMHAKLEETLRQHGREIAPFNYNPNGEDRFDQVYGALDDLPACTDASKEYLYTADERSNLIAAGWPLPNVWLGVSVEDQAAADERIPLLLQVPAAVRWISAEPLLGTVQLRDEWLRCPGGAEYGRGLSRTTVHAGCCSTIDWVVAGGESGPGSRPMHPDWARSLRDQCAAAGVAFFFKQWGAWAPIQYVDATDRHELIKLVFTDREKAIGGPAEGTAPCNVKRVGKKHAGRQLDGRTHDEYPTEGK